MTAALLRNDSKAIWNAIDWSGSVLDESCYDKPNITEFKNHFEGLLRVDYDEPLHVPHVCT